MEEFGKKLANNIRAERNRNRLTQLEVSEKLGISDRTYKKLEDDASKISAKQLAELSEILNCKIDVFFINV